MVDCRPVQEHALPSLVTWALAPYPEAAAAVQERFERVMAEMTGTAPSMRLGSVDTEGEER